MDVARGDMGPNGKTGEVPIVKVGDSEEPIAGEVTRDAPPDKRRRRRREAPSEEEIRAAARLLSLIPARWRVALATAAGAALVAALGQIKAIWGAPEKIDKVAAEVALVKGSVDELTAAHAEMERKLDLVIRALNLRRVEIDGEPIP
jgi:hypothetical protein